MNCMARTLQVYLIILFFYDREPVFKDLMQDVFIGYSRDLTPRLNVMPFVSCFINDEPVTDKSFWLGAWISYQIK